MRKYLAFLRVNLQNAVAYRGPMIIWLASNIVTLTIFISLWLSSTMIGGDIAGYSKNQLVTYYLVGLLLQWIVGWYPFWIKDDIKNGDIAGNTISKPINFYWKVFFIDLGWHLVSMWVALLAVLMMGYILFPYLVLSLTFTQIVVSILAIIVAIFVTFSTCICLGLLAFWFTHIGAVEGLFWAGRSIFGGEGIPIALFSINILPFIKLLPFRYMYSFPLEILMGKLQTSDLIWGFITGLVWIGILVWLYKFMWREGLKKYNSAGI